LGESQVDVTQVSDACVAGHHLLALRPNCPIVTNTAKQRGRPAGSSKKNRMEGVLTSLKKMHLMMMVMVVLLAVDLMFPHALKNWKMAMGQHQKLIQVTLRKMT
jgi:hypothetical protein